jgi:foldase protein PrsA
MILQPLLLAIAVVQQTFASDLPKELVVAPPPPTQVMATVNGVPIRAEDVQAFLLEWRAQEVVEDLINYQVVRTEAQKHTISVTDQEVTEELDRLLKQVEEQLQPGQTLAETLLAEGQTRSRLFLRLKTEMLLRRLILRDFNQADYVKVSTMVFPAQSPQSDHVAEALKRAEEAYARLERGESWDDVLQSVTTDQRALAARGQLGWRQTTAFPETVQEQFKQIKITQVTKPAQTVNGFQIFRLEMTGRDASGDDLEELQNLFFQSMRNQKFEELRAAAKIERQPGR